MDDLSIACDVDFGDDAVSVVFVVAVDGKAVVLNEFSILSVAAAVGPPVVVASGQSAAYFGVAAGAAVRVDTEEAFSDVAGIVHSVSAVFVVAVVVVVFAALAVDGEQNCSVAADVVVVGGALNYSVAVVVDGPADTEAAFSDDGGVAAAVPADTVEVASSGVDAAAAAAVVAASIGMSRQLH